MKKLLDSWDAYEDAIMAPLLKLLSEMIWDAPAMPLEYAATDEGYPEAYAVAVYGPRGCPTGHDGLIGPCGYGPAGGWPSLEACEACGSLKMLGLPCPACVPTGKAKCPASLAGEQQHNKPKCRLCKGSGFVPELT
jgi:hypothetical protein